MSHEQLTRQRSVSRTSKRSLAESTPLPPAPSITPKNDDAQFQPCAATASFFLYAQRNEILCLHHDTLAIDRRFQRHREDIAWIAVDNVSERGSGRLVVSYDVGNTAIVWDLFTGEEVARFASYEQIRIAAWMKNGNVAFGNSQGNVILFEPSTSEHISARTIFDPITSLAPMSDCRTFAIGYFNGSILIATLQPTFTILHTLTTPRIPSPVAGLAWHGSSAKQKNDMLATQARDGDLRVWSVPKTHSAEAPCIIRVLNRNEYREPGLCWFGWSRNGRIIQYTEGQTLSWDVRTKRVAAVSVPTIEGVVAIANYGPTATLFTMGQSHTVQQYDINPNNEPALVANVQHVPANTPPSPPNMLDDKINPQHIQRLTGANLAAKSSADSAPSSLPVYLESDMSEEDGAALSPLVKVAQEMEQLEEERRDMLAPLSPVSSRSSNSSRSSGGGSRRREYRYDKPSPLGSVSGRSEFTEFSMGSARSRSKSSSYSSRYRASSLRHQIRPDEREDDEQTVDLFPNLRANLSKIPFKSPVYGAYRTVDDLRQQMLLVVFGWDGSAEELIRAELASHPPGSGSGVLLSKWLGELGADSLATMMGSESMTSSDWMLLALSAMGHDSQKKVGQAFVQRLAEKGDIHPAVAILIGLGDYHEAIDFYASRKCFLEAVLLTCLVFPNDWQRQSFLIRKWGEQAVTQGEPELAVRCFSCASIESSEQHAFEAVESSPPLASPPLSPPANVGPSRMVAKNSALKLITTFGDKAASNLLPPSAAGTETPMAHGVTPIAESALSPGGAAPWLRSSARDMSREPISARTATPGSYSRRRYPSRTTLDRSIAAADDVETPLTTVTDAVITSTLESRKRSESIASSSHKRATSSSFGDAPLLLSATIYDPAKENLKKTNESLPSPAAGVFTAFRDKHRNGSRDRKPEGLSLKMAEQIRTGPPSSLLSSALPRDSDFSPLPSGASVSGVSVQSVQSVQSSKVRSIDDYISSLNEANYRSRRTESRSRNESREGRSRSRARDTSESRGRSGGRYIRPAKRSPSSPKPMSPEDSDLFKSSGEQDSLDNYDDERYYGVTSPTESRSGRPRSRSKARNGVSQVRASSKTSRRHEATTERPPSRTRGSSSRRQPPEPLKLRSTSRQGTEQSRVQSPSSPEPMSRAEPTYNLKDAVDELASETSRRARQRSTSRRPGGRSSSTRPESPNGGNRRNRSETRRAQSREPTAHKESSPPRPSSRQSTRSNRSTLARLQTDLSERRVLTTRADLTKEQAQRELEERRLSLARRPSAPVIPLPGDIAFSARSPMSSRSNADFGPLSMSPHDFISRSQTVDPESMSRYTHSQKKRGVTSTTSIPIGLPATPRAMRHPKYMGSNDPNDKVPSVPQVPQEFKSENTMMAPPPPPPPPPTEDIGILLLPSTVYGQSGPQAPLMRAASAPPEKAGGVVRRGSLASRGHGRKLSPTEPLPNYKRISPPPIRASIDEALHDSTVQVVIEDEVHVPPMLAELQHLAGPPPPPPPPTMFNPAMSSPNALEVINIAIDDNTSVSGSKPQALVIDIPSQPVRGPASAGPGRMSTISPPPAGSASAHGHRRGRGSVSDIGSKIRGVADRMRSSSRSRARSPQVEHSHQPMPYESVLAPGYSRQESFTRTRSPIEVSAGAQFDLIPPPPPPPPIPTQEQQQNGGQLGYRSPKEIRANMPPEQLQYGVFQNSSGMF